MKIETERIGELSCQEADILTSLQKKCFVNQRSLSECSGHSLGVVNRSLKRLMNLGYLDEQIRLTDKANALFEDCEPKSAIILAAGFGMRMVPINMSTPKALLEVNGERLIERQIKQLHNVGITDITVVTGFMKESFEYLIDEYDVNLIVNEQYAEKNNLHSLNLALDKIGNTYIVPCDIWSDTNPFNTKELYSWYMVSDLIDEDSMVRVNRKMELVTVGRHESGNEMIGIAYLLSEDAELVKKNIRKLCEDKSYDDSFWETAICENHKMIVRARVVHGLDVVEINTYEQLRELDAESNQLKSDAMKTIVENLGCRNTDIEDITVLKKGMTNRSFLFSVDNKKYIMRIPGEGTDRLINRQQEANVYSAIHGRGLCDDPLYINPDNGYKITRYISGVRTCNSKDTFDLQRCMAKLRELHGQHIQVSHTFDIWEQIEFYEKLWAGKKSVYRDYKNTKEKLYELMNFISGVKKDYCLTHIDAVPDNFLFYTLPDGREEVQLTDWEYAGMQDPHVDIAMFCIYSRYDKWECDDLIDIYFENQCDDTTRTKIYCYIAICGLLWSNWCEYKRMLGVEFGEYSIRQYRYAKEFYKYAKKRIEQNMGVA